MNRFASLASGLAFAALALAAPLSAQASTISASWSTTATPCTDCAVSLASGGLEVTTSAPVSALVLDIELSNVVSGVLTDLLEVYHGSTLLGSIDLGSTSFSPADLGLGAQYTNPVTARLFRNYLFLRSGYLSIDAGGDAFDRLLIVGHDQSAALNGTTGQYVGQPGQLPEPGGMALVLAGWGALLLARRRAS